MAGTRKRTTRQEFVFAYEYARWGEKVRAMRIAYPTLANNSEAMVASKANNVLRRERVRKAITDLQNEMRASEKLTLETHMAHLAHLRDKAVDSGQIAAAVRAEELRGKASGFYIDRMMVQHEVSDRGQLVEKLQMLLENNPHLVSLLPENVKRVISTSRPAAKQLPGGDGEAPEDHDADPLCDDKVNGQDQTPGTGQDDGHDAIREA